MEKSKQTLTDRVAKLEQTAADHERRITALEARPGQKPQKRTSTSFLDDTLDEFDELLKDLHELDL